MLAQNYKENINQNQKSSFVMENNEKLNVKNVVQKMSRRTDENTKAQEPRISDINNLFNKINIASSCEPVDEQRQLINEKVYSEDILKTLIYRDSIVRPKNCLKMHKITPALRAKMVDWMVEVLSSYKCCQQTFFMAVNLMDYYFQLSTPLEMTDLHITGVVAMFLASKYEEIYPLRLQIVHEKIAHKKISTDQIRKQESKMLETIGYNLPTCSLYEFVTLILDHLQLQENLSKENYEYLEKVCVYLAKMSLHDYDLINSQSYFQLSSAIIYVSFKIIEQLDSSFPMQIKVNKILKFVDISNQQLVDTAAKVLNAAKNFDKMFPNLENLKKFSGFSLDGSNPFAKK